MFFDTENATLEFKLEYSENFLKTVSAFANYNKGKIFFGVADDGTVIGVEDSRNIRLKIENAINDNISPRPEYLLESLKTEDRDVVQLTVYRGYEPPYFYKGKAYKRTDTATTPIDPSEMRSLLHQELEGDYDQAVVADRDLTFSILEEELRLAKGINELDEDTLRTLDLMRDGAFTRAAQWLADVNNNFRCATNIVRFGSNISVFRDRMDIEQVSLISQYKGALEMYEKWYGDYEEVMGFERVNRVMIPQESYREAVLNALIHRRLDINSAVRIAMFDDRIEITSPGALPHGISKADYLFGRVSNPRNPTISMVFYLLKYIEKFGTGISRIRQGYDGFSNRPKFELADNYLRVTLPVIDYNLHLKDEDLETSILRLLGGYYSLSRSELEEHTGYGASSLQNALKHLIDASLVRRTGAGRSTRYELLR